MNIREASKKDSQGIARLIRDLAEKFIIPEFSEKGRQQFLSSNDQNAIEEFFDDGFVYHVAEESGVIVGVVGIRQHSHLYHLFVAETHQGHGLSRKLWTVAMNRCLSAGEPRHFTVNSSNHAVGVYEAFGFKRTAGMQESHGVLYNPMSLLLNNNKHRPSEA